MISQDAGPTKSPTRIQAKRSLLEAAAAIAFSVVILAFVSDASLTRYYYMTQDRYVGALMAATLAALAWLHPKLPRDFTKFSTHSIWWIATGLALVLWAGTYLVMYDYALTRDELMARFDAEIFASGVAAMPTQEHWRDYTLALIPNFLEPVSGYETWVSSYMPVHALIRAGMSHIADPALLNPLLAGVGLVSIAAVARRLFPDQAGAQWVVILGYLLSAQVLIAAMTSYAMTAHLAFNCLWLLLFLKDRYWSHVLAMVVGVLAIGLHQIIFHPIFAGPILLWLLTQRRWTLFGVYAVVYAIALVSWIGFHGWATGGVATTSGEGSGAVEFLLRRALPLLTSFNPYTVPLMLYNLLRFSVWLPFFILPLFLMAWPLVKLREGFALPLAAGLILTIIAMAWMQAYQGHGWGYRYLHGVIPNALLLAGMGYARWSKENAPDSRGFVTVASIMTLPALVFLMDAARGFLTPYFELSEQIERQETDFVILDTTFPASAVDQVRNRADLTNRPMIFASEHLSQDQVGELCARGTITVIDRSSFELPVFGSRRVPNPDYPVYRDWIKAEGCYREALP